MNRSAFLLIFLWMNTVSGFSFTLPFFAGDSVGYTMDISAADSLLKQKDYIKAGVAYQELIRQYQGEKSDTTYVKVLQRLSVCYLYMGKFAESEKYALEFLEASQSQDSLYLGNAYSLLGELYANQGRPKEALAFSKKALSLFKSNFPNQLRKIWTIYQTIGVIQIRVGMYRESLETNKTIVEEVKANDKEESFTLTDIYDNIGIAYFYLGDYDAAIEYQQQSLAIAIELIGTEHPVVGNIHQNLAISYQSKFDYKEAFRNYEKSLQILRKAYGDRHVLVARALNNICGILLDQMEFNQAKEYADKALSILIAEKESLGEVIQDLSFTYLNLGTIASNAQDYNKALYCYRAAIEVDAGIYGDKHPFIAESYVTIGDVHRKIGQYDSAIYYHEKAQEINQSMFESTHPTIINDFNNLGKDYAAAQLFDQSITYFQKVLSLQDLRGDEDVKALGTAYFELSKISILTNDTVKAVDYIQKCLEANSIGFTSQEINDNPASARVLNRSETIKVLQLKTELLLMMNTANSLESVINTSLLADTLIREYRQNAINFEDKLALGTSAHGIYEAAMTACFLLNESASSGNWLQSLLMFSDRDKSAVLSEAIIDLSARQVGLLPDTLLNLEKQIKKQTSYYQSKLLQSAEEDSTQRMVLNSRLFDLKRKEDSLVNVLEQKHQRYYNAKYNPEALTIAQIQAGLARDAALVAYAMSRTQMMAIVITQGTTKVVSLGNRKEIDQYITVFRNSLTSRDRLSNSNYDVFANAAYKLYQELFAPLEDLLKKESITNLLIVPDQELNHLPFEALITAKPEGNYTNYQNLDYLLSHYAISYQYSARLAFSPTKSSQPNKKMFLGFAPTFSNIDADAESMITTRGSVVNLKWNSSEVETIQKLFDSEVYVGETAKESALKESLEHSRIVHLATHAIVDENNILNSQIVLANEQDSLQDGILHAFEIYNLRLNTELVTLSACNTGFGVLNDGEGSMTLARAFSYAGVQSVVMSHWEVDDKLTSDLMAHFYQNINNGMKKDQALQQAKLSLIAESDALVSNPYYWSAFVLVGSTDPIVASGVQTWMIVAGLCLLLIVGFFVLRRRF